MLESLQKRLTENYEKLDVYSFLNYNCMLTSWFLLNGPLYETFTNKMPHSAMCAVKCHISIPWPSCIDRMWLSACCYRQPAVGHTQGASERLLEQQRHEMVCRSPQLPYGLRRKGWLQSRCSRQPPSMEAGSSTGNPRQAGKPSSARLTQRKQNISLS